MSNFTQVNRLTKLASILENKYVDQIQKSAIYGGSGTGSLSSGYVSGVGSSLSETEFTKINDFVTKTIPEFESFLKNIVPALREMKKQYNQVVKDAKAKKNNLKDLAEINNIDWDWGKPIPDALQTVMLSSMMTLDPVSKFFTKIASADFIRSIAAKIALANKSLSFFERLKDKAKSFFGKKTPEEVEYVSYFPGLDIDLERKATFALKGKLENITEYINSYIELYKDFYKSPTIYKIDYLLEDAAKFKSLLEPIKSEIKQLQDISNPSEEVTEELFFEGEGISGKSSMMSLLSYIMKDPNLSNPLNVKRALKLHRMLEEKLRDAGAL